MQNVDEPCIQAQLRVEASRWVGTHPGSAIGCDVLGDTVARASTFEPWWSLQDVTDLVPIVARVLGVEQVEAMARQIRGSSSATDSRSSRNGRRRCSALGRRAQE